MKLFRLLALMLAIGILPAFLIQARAQQEVDPDHYEPMQVSQVSRPGAKAYTGHRHSHTRMASKHSGRANHHRARVSA